MLREILSRAKGFISNSNKERRLLGGKKDEFGVHRTCICRRREDSGARKLILGRDGRRKTKHSSFQFVNTSKEAVNRRH